MKQGLATELAPSPSVVLPHFAFSALSFLFLSMFTVLGANEFLGHFINGKVLAITHFATLGWISMVIFGALYQLIPVVMEVALYSERLAKINFTFLSIGIILLIYSFWVNNYGMPLLIAASILLIAVILFAINILLTAKSTKKWNIESSFIVASVIWLLTTATLGFLISANFKHVFFPAAHLEYLKAHAHAGMIGWFLLLIIGVGAVLLPMFFLSHNLNRKRLQWAFYLINTGLGIYFIDTVFVHINMYVVPVLFVSAGILFFMLFVYESYKKRVRKQLDVSLKHSVLSILLLILPVLLAALISISPKSIGGAFIMRATILYGMSILLGFITSLILGQAYKTLPFILWLHKYQKFVGKYKTPLPKDLYSEKILDWQYWAYILTIIVLFSGVLSGIGLLIQAGTYLLVITAVLYNINIYKIFTHKVKEKNLEKL